MNIFECFRISWRALVSNKIYQINNISSWNGSGTAFAATIPDAGLLAAIAVKQ